MGQYSIKDLETLSGIKAHTLRIWEKRYGIINPKRTDTNIRYYSDADLKKILNISILNDHGLKISKIADLSYADITQRIAEIENTTVSIDHNLYIDKLIITMIDLDEARFTQQLNGIKEEIGFENMVTQILYPFLHRIGVLWQTGNINPAHEHFISNLIRQKLIAAIDALPIAEHSNKTALLFLPENEWHELGLLFSHYICRKRGIHSVYLGQSVPYSDLYKVTETNRPDYIISYVIAPISEGALLSFIEKLATDFANTQIFISGGFATTIARSSLPKHVTVFKTAHELNMLLS